MNEKTIVVPGVCQVHLIPKVASATVNRAFLREKRHMIQPALTASGGFRWMPVRHPLDRTVSLYSYFCNPGMGLNGQPQVRKLGYYEGQPFEAFLDVLFENHWRNIHTQRQSDFIGDNEADHYANFDRLQEEWTMFCARFPGLHVMRQLPHIHKTPHASWETYYTPETRKRAEEFFALDMTLHEKATSHGYQN